MTAVAIRPPTLFDEHAEETLDGFLLGTWTALMGHRTVECPVCGGRMRPEYGVHALPIAGRCENCASSLS